MIENIKPIKIVSMLDPVLKCIPEDKLIAYARDRDISKIENLFEPGKAPTVYHARRLPRSIWNRFVATQSTEELKAQAAFQYGVFKVENLRTDDSFINFEPTGSVATGDGEISIIKSEEMSRFYHDELSEIGGVVYLRSFFRPWIDVIYQPPRLSVEQWAKQAVLYAAANQTMLVQSNEKHSSLDDQPQIKIDPTGESDVSKSGGPTDAIAEVR